MCKTYKKKRFYKTSNKPKEEYSNMGKSGYENEDRTHFWGPEYICKN